MAIERAKALAAAAAAVAVCSTAAFGEVYGDLPDSTHAWAVHDWNRPKPAKVAPAAQIGQPPSDAVVLFDGTKESFEKNWCDDKGGPSQWKYSPDGYFYTIPGWKNGGAVYTRTAFGDCQLHVEYRHDAADVAKHVGQPQMRGNSGIFLMGNYEIQVLESYATSREMEGKPGYVDNYADGQAGSVYAENPPLVNPARPCGEWQVYDIVFHQPVWDGLRLVHPGSVSVFFNGVLVQDHWEMEGLTTHRVRRPLAPHKKVGPLSLQDHGCIVQYRNIWYRPLASRWANTTHSALSGDANDVMKLRRETAARLFAKIEKPIRPTIANMEALGEVIGYAREGEYDRQWRVLAEAFHAVLDGMTDEEWKSDRQALLHLRGTLDALIRAGVVPQKCGTRRRISAAALRLGWEK